MTSAKEQKLADYQEQLRTQRKYRGYDLISKDYGLWEIIHPEQQLTPELAGYFTSPQIAKAFIDQFEAAREQT